MKSTILIVTDYFLPGYRHGGPVKSIKNLIQALANSHKISLLTRDRDKDASQPYVQEELKILENQLNFSGSYVKNKAELIKTLLQSQHEIMYLNSFFSLWFSFIPVVLAKLGLISTYKIILAPRGELEPQALQIKPLKKKIFLWLTRFFKIHKGLVWQATSETEEKNLRELLGDSAKISLLTNGADSLAVASSPPVKTPGSLKIIFLSRITPKKNLIFALDCCRYLSGDIEFDIYGPTEDRAYWAQCEKLIVALPANVKVNYRGEVKAEAVMEVFSRYHLFFFPTWSENYGHVIVEALAAQVPVLLSDATPWNDIEKFNAGWAFSLHDQQKFCEKINELVACDQAEFSKFNFGSRYYYELKCHANDYAQQACDFFSLL